MKLGFALLSLLVLALVLPAADAPPQKTVLTAARSEFKTVGQETRFVFYGSPQKRVTLTGTNIEIVCDYLEIIAVGVGGKTEAKGTLPTPDRFKYLLATGNVHMVQEDREANCGRAEVFPREDKIELTEKPTIVDHGSDVKSPDGKIDHHGDVKQAGSKITMLRGERRVLIENPEAEAPELKDLGPKATPAAPAK